MRSFSTYSFQTMATRTGKLDVFQTDVSPKKIQIQKKPHRYLTMVGRVGVTRCDAIQQRRISATIFQREQDIVCSWHWTLCTGCPPKFPLYKIDLMGHTLVYTTPTVLCVHVQKSNSELGSRTCNTTLTNVPVVSCHVNSLSIWTP